MIRFIEERIAAHENAVVLEPRGHAKTTWGNTILGSFLASKYPNLRIGLISNTATQAFAFSRGIRMTLEANEYQHEVFGNLAGKHKWNDHEWITNHSTTLMGSPYSTLYAQGAGGAILSKRFDLILCDDILDEENSANPEQREKVENWFWKTLKPCLAPQGSIIVLGTRWSEGDLYQRLIEEKKWPSLVRGAIHYDADDTEQRRPKALWPDFWTLDKLEQERKDMGSAMFACAYLNDISGLMAGNIFRREWFSYFNEAGVFVNGEKIRDLPNPADMTWKMGVDLASSERQRADFTARVVIAEDRERNVYVWSVVRDKIETGHRGFIGDGYNAFPLISKIVVESNQFQSSFVKDLLAETPWPIVGKKAEIDKVTRARAVAARYESRKVFHHQSLAGSDFEIELLQFPKGHDDQIDALGHAMETGAGGAFFGSFTSR